MLTWCHKRHCDYRVVQQRVLPLCIACNRSLGSAWKTADVAPSGVSVVQVPFAVVIIALSVLTTTGAGKANMQRFQQQ